MQTLDAINKNRQKRLRSGMLITSIAVGYTLLTTVLLPFCLASDSIPGWVIYLLPHSITWLFLLSFFEALWVLLPLALIPVAGCVLLAKKKRVGRQMILVPQVLLLAMYALITPLHVFIGAGVWSMAYIREALLLGIASLALPVITLCGLHRWTDNIRYE